MDSNYWSAAKQQKAGRYGIITQVYADRTLKMIFEDGKVFHFPFEAVRRQVNLFLVEEAFKSNMEAATNLINKTKSWDDNASSDQQKLMNKDSEYGMSIIMSQLMEEQQKAKMNEQGLKAEIDELKEFVRVL